MNVIRYINQERIETELPAMEIANPMEVQLIKELQIRQFEEAETHDE